jgi:hypothetical protein
VSCWSEFLWKTDDTAGRRWTCEPDTVTFGDIGSFNHIHQRLQFLPVLVRVFFSFEKTLFLVKCSVLENTYQKLSCSVLVSVSAGALLSLLIYSTYTKSKHTRSLKIFDFLVLPPCTVVCVTRVVLINIPGEGIVNCLE